MHGTHDTPLVLLSIFIAMCASYTALTLAGRVSVARGHARLGWLLGGCIAMGSGIWSMHFVAMLAFHLPVPISYDVPQVTLSHLAAVGASAFALWVASRQKVGTLRLCAAGFGLGLAIVTMHYTGMAAVRVQARLTYDPWLVAASVAIAIGAATVALWLFLWLRNDNSNRGRIFRVLAAVVMGLAISGMHYTAMYAAQFTEIGTYTPVTGRYLLGAAGLAFPVVVGAFVILALTVAGSLTDRWVRSKIAAAEALRESEERYRSVVSEIDEVIFRADVKGRFTFLNPAWTQITGYTPEESLGTFLLDSVHGDDRDTSEQQTNLLATGVDYCRHEVRYLTKDGGWRWVEVHARVTRDADGAVAGTAGVIRDVTERRRSEEALRTAREVAEAASRAKSEFLSRMSHELRTPLNAILGFGQLMELDANTPGQRENADQIMKAGRHLLHLINEVLDITGIESGRLNLSAEPVGIGNAATEVFDLVGPLASVRGIKLQLDGATDGKFVHADRQRLKQILLNIVANAVKYNHEGGSAMVSCEPGGAGRMRITVTDTGPGIAAEKMPRLFTPFDRLGAEQTGVEGTGLGLALSRRLAQAMDGEIGLRSKPGAGTTFWIELPVDTSPIADIEAALAEESLTEKRRPASPQKYTILYVEDNLSNLTLVQRIVALRKDIELIPAMQGGLALELARTHRPDMVLLDLHLPDIGGEEVLRQLRAAPDCREIPVVILSADATQGQADRLLAAGAAAYITKPLDVRPFIDILDGVLEGRAAA